MPNDDESTQLPLLDILASENLSNVAVATPLTLEFLSGMADTLAAGTVDLPAFPQVVIKVQAAFKDPNYTPQSIARVVSSERSLADRLLQMANSTAFNATGRVIIDLGVAINRLGAQKVYSVALGHAVAHIRQSELLRSIAPKLDELWAECVIVAHFSDAIVKRSALPFPGAFAAGLLHGIGRFYILVQSAKQSKSHAASPIECRADRSHGILPVPRPCSRTGKWMRLFARQLARKRRCTSYAPARRR